ncbi:hypothetical protein O181_043181 [Austropuccinia psidii MF-1]|uniref:Tet-like 2OG-Fe(II) oxygenase domain-containing protein n=1 Tax=Austropuccinia psidii MF-1 TaxID=1389203 RepID=A0A9Q3DN02_9BASI|nr:hypothetical protein [Austropuccinia psidii MF-1]
MVCSDDWRTSSFKGALSLIDISKRLSEGKNLVEPVWLRINKYICNLLNKCFFSSESFNPIVTLRFEFAQCSVLDFGDAWVEMRGLGSSYEVTLTVTSQFGSSQCHVGSNREFKDVCQIKFIGLWEPFWTQKALGSNGRKKYLISCQLPHKVIPHPLGNSGTSQKTNEAKTTQKNMFFPSTRPKAQILMPVSPNMTPSEIQRVVDVNQIKRIHFGCIAIFSSTRLLIALVKFGPFTTMSEVEVNQWDELSKFLFCERKFTEPIAINGALLEGFMFPIGWLKCRTRNEQFGFYGSLRKIEATKDECQNRGANLSLVGCILGQFLKYVGDKLFQKVQTCCKSLGFCPLIKATMKPISPQITVHAGLLLNSLSP